MKKNKKGSKEVSISRNSIMLLLVIVIVLSVVGTISLLTNFDYQNPINQQQPTKNKYAGQISFTLINTPQQSSNAQISLEIV